MLYSFFFISTCKIKEIFVDKLLNSNQIKQNNFELIFSHMASRKSDTIGRTSITIQYNLFFNNGKCIDAKLSTIPANGNIFDRDFDEYLNSN